MATFGDYTITLHADTRPLERALRRVKRLLWWNRWGGLLMATAYFVVGLLIGLSY